MKKLKIRSLKIKGNIKNKIIKIIKKIIIKRNRYKWKYKKLKAFLKNIILYIRKLINMIMIIMKIIKLIKYIENSYIEQIYIFQTMTFFEKLIL